MSSTQKSEYNAMIFNFLVLVRAKVPNCIESYIGDGYCDDDNNNDACQFDGGDCCNQSTIQWNMYCYVRGHLQTTLTDFVDFSAPPCQH